VLGPGPVAETFPDRLAPLEVDLWLAPLRDGLALAIGLAGVAPRRRLERSPVALAVDGWAAVDLDLLEPPGHRRGLRLLDPRPPYRRVKAAWRVGRLRGAMPALVDAEVAHTDRLLAEVPALAELDDGQLLGLLDRTRELLVGLHAHEVLAGILVTPGAQAPGGASAGLAALARAHAAGLRGPAVAAAEPAVLALVPPRIGPGAKLPDGSGSSPPSDAGPPPDPLALARELARMRVRWAQELGARAAFELGRRLSTAGQIDEPWDVRRIPFADLERLVRAGEAVEPRPEVCTGPLPTRFRLGPDGAPVPVEDRHHRRHGPGARGAGGGRGRGVVVDAVPAPPGSVLVVTHLDPALAPHLPGLAGLVAETGSELSHLAILARELGVPTVVGLGGATTELRPGLVVTVDGSTGEVRTVDEAVPSSPEARPGPGGTR
jgi:pyruvate,water dikinase